jgi:hypothetical protein
MTLWITVVNLALGLGVLACLGTVLFGALSDVFARARRRSRLYAEMDEHAVRLRILYGDALAVPKPYRVGSCQ